MIYYIIIVTIYIAYLYDNKQDIRECQVSNEGYTDGVHSEGPVPVK